MVRSGMCVRAVDDDPRAGGGAWRGRAAATAFRRGHPGGRGGRRACRRVRAAPGASADRGHRGRPAGRAWAGRPAGQVRRVAAAVLDGPPRAPFPASPAGLLADLAGPEPRLVLPDPDGPGRGALIEATLRRYSQGRPAAIGPAVPLAAAARSLRWARQALGLARRGIIAADGPVRAADHLSTLLLLADEDLARTLLGGYLTPLARLRPGQRDRLARTMLAWLQFGENAAEVAQHMHVHPQTVRYRLRQIQELFGDQLRDPDRRLDLQLALRARDLLGVPLAE